MRTTPCLIVAALLALPGCRETDGEARQAVAEPAGAEPTAAPSGTPITAVGDLLGEYRVAGIDGQPLDASFGIAVSIDGPVLSFEPTCAGFVWDLAFKDGRLETQRATTVAVEQGMPPPPVCAVAVHPAQTRLAQALDAVDSAVRLPSNGIELAGGGRSVTLFSQ